MVLPSGSKQIAKLLRSVHNHNPYPLFSDCMESMACAISNAVDFNQRAEREKRYMANVERYGRDVMGVFSQVMAHTVEALDQEWGDVLGQTFHELELHNDARGQFFTPYDLCRLMAQMTFGAEDLAEKVAQRGYITAQEPAAGSGAMVIALAEAMKAQGVNYQQHLHVTAIDVDPRAVHMAYVQLSLLHIPAVVIVGNTLSMEMGDHWYTPAHILGGWDWKLRRTEREPEAPVAEPIEVVHPPEAVRQKAVRGEQLGFDIGL